MAVADTFRQRVLILPLRTKVVACRSMRFLGGTNPLIFQRIQMAATNGFVTRMLSDRTLRMRRMNGFEMRQNGNLERLLILSSPPCEKPKYSISRLLPGQQHRKSSRNLGRVGEY